MGGIQKAGSRLRLLGTRARGLALLRGICIVLSLGSLWRLSACQPIGPEAEPSPSPFSGPWHYHYGDSPLHTDGTPVFAQHDAHGTDWPVIARSRNPPNRNENNFLWLCAKIETPTYQNPVFHILTVDQIFEAYLNGKKLHSFGSFQGPTALQFHGYTSFYIKLPPDYSGKYITFRIFSNHRNIGIDAGIRIGSALGLVRSLAFEDSGRLLVSILLITLGVVGLGVAAATYRGNNGMLWYGGFSLTLGVWMTSQLHVRVWLLPEPMIWIHVEIMCLFLAVAFMLKYIQFLFSLSSRSFIGISSSIIGIYTPLSFLLAALGVISILQSLFPFQVFLIICISYTLLLCVKYSMKGNIEARIFSFGFAAAGLFSSYDVLVGFGVFAGSRLSFSHYGQGLFNLALGLIAARRLVAVFVDRALTKQQLSRQNELLQAALRMAQGDLNTPIRLANPGEFKTLADGLESMRNDVLTKMLLLEDRHTEIQQLNDELRRQIAQRSKLLVESLIGAEKDTDSEESPALATGDLLAGRYLVMETLGQGTTGTVYLVERTTDKKRFAAKVLGGSPTRQMMARFAQEAQLLAQLKHPNLITIVDADITQEKLAYIIMERVEGSTLEDLQERYGDVGFALPVLSQVASALSAVHAQGVVHRDLKPANVLVAIDGESGRPTVKLGDFGVSRLVDAHRSTEESGASRRAVERVATADGDAAPGDDLAMGKSAGTGQPAGPAVNGAAAPVERSPAEIVARADGSEDSWKPRRETSKPTRRSSEKLTQTGMIVGTPLYMAPELVKGSRDAQPSSDVFGFGVMAFELLSRELPFDELPMLAMLQRGKTPTLRALGTLAKNLPTGLTQLIDRCLEQDPARRPTAAVLATELSHAAQALFKEGARAGTLDEHGSN